MSEYILPLLLFFFAATIFLLLRILILDVLQKWAESRNWPTYIAIGAIWHPMLILSLLIGLLIGVFALSQDIPWKTDLVKLILSIMMLITTLSAMVFTNRIASYFQGQIASNPFYSGIRNVVVATTVILASLVAAGVWGVASTQIFVSVLALFAVLFLLIRDAGPDYFAALQLGIREQIQIGETIRLQDGEQGVVINMGWHCVEIKTPDGKLLIIPNNRLTKQIVTKYKENAVAVKPQYGALDNQRLSPSVIQNKKTSQELISVLSRREMEIAKLVSQGATNKELAKTLFITENTVKMHIRNILHKLEIKNRQQLAVLAAFQSLPKSG
ncbi:LuxR C-terminal-related transcriptional regulator [Dehalogenimonas etheniformans]|nr:LuxR C-terminal-related transcriptional regulator [Dehalogenimonas etheniformans]